MSAEQEWTKIANEQLLNRKIVAVRYMTAEEAYEFGWTSRCVVLHLDDGNLIFPSRDDEGNGPGVLFTNNEEHSGFPVIR